MSTYDDKIDELLETRRRNAEERKAMRQKQCMMQIAYICIAVCIVVLLIVGIKKIVTSKNDTGSNTNVSEVNVSSEDSSGDDISDSSEEESSDDTDSGDTQQDFTGMTVYCTDNVNLREQASTDSEVITVVSAGESVEVEEQEEEWCKVKYGDKEGYLKLEYLTDNYEQ